MLMPAKILAAGQKFARLTTLGPFRNAKGGLWFLCRCKCGAVRFYKGATLRNGHIKSCGCLKAQCLITGRTKHGHSTRERLTPTYRTWQAMKSRCLNPSVACYANYGGRGITVCGQWMRFENFLADMGEKPDGLTIERINNHGNYESSNCRWARSEEQAANKRTNRFLTINNKTLCIAEWARVSGTDKSTISRRVKLGWHPQSAVFDPPMSRAQRGLLGLQARGIICR